jgi:hypothetical protein
MMRPLLLAIACLVGIWACSVQVIGGGMGQGRVPRVLLFHDSEQGRLGTASTCAVCGDFWSFFCSLARGAHLVLACYLQLPSVEAAVRPPPPKRRPPPPRPRPRPPRPRPRPPPRPRPRPPPRPRPRPPPRPRPRPPPRPRPRPPPRPRPRPPPRPRPRPPPPALCVTVRSHYRVLCVLLACIAANNDRSYGAMLW